MSSSFYDFAIPNAAQFSTEQMEKVDACLDELAGSTGAPTILLTDTTGQLIVSRGHIDAKKAEALAALIVGSHAASAEFIKLLAKKTPFINIFHETEGYSIFSTNVADVVILSVAFGNEVKIGVVRVFVEQARRRLTEIIHEASMNNSEVVQVKMQLVDDEFDRLLDKELEKITEH
jgi:predicted regulator of Ras-like GTPase activity (Roadblock/LC7/MglB family)